MYDFLRDITRIHKLCVQMSLYLIIISFGCYGGHASQRAREGTRALESCYGDIDARRRGRCPLQSTHVRILVSALYCITFIIWSHS